MPRIGRRINRARGTMGIIITMHVSIVICAVPIMRQSETDLTGAVAVRMRGSHRRTGVRVRVAVAKAVAVRRRREMT